MVASETSSTTLSFTIWQILGYSDIQSLAVVQWKMLVMEMETFQTLQDVANMEGAWDPCEIPLANVIQVGPGKIVATRRCLRPLNPNRM
jgi:hypothetical protein